jgi:predicted HTH transcriptional regulator
MVVLKMEGYQLNKLTKEGIIKREGSKKTGVWRILKRE